MYSKNDNNYFIKNSLPILRILYVEDEVDIRKSITKILNYFTEQVISASSGEEAMEVYEKFHPDIIICDINLPGISGIDFVKWLRAKDETTQVFLLTAYTDKEYLLDAIKLNLVDYLIKPIDFDILIKTIKYAADKVIELKTLNVEFISGAVYSYQECKIIFENETNILTIKEVTLLNYLIENKSRIVAKEELKNYLWDYDLATETAFKSLMNKLRSKIGKDSIKNISGVGYKIIIKENSF